MTWSLVPEGTTSKAEAIPRTDTGELEERRLEHRQEAEKFYRELAAQGMNVRVGMEASGQGRWFERLLAELNIELWIGDATEIARKRERKQKTDRQDAQHILRLMLKDDFPQIWVPSGENRDLRQLLWHRHRWVQARTRMMNPLQAVASGNRIALSVASRSRAIWDWCRWRIRVGIGDGWDTSRNKGTLCYVSCWWKRRK
jgi:Transposase